MIRTALFAIAGLLPAFAQTCHPVDGDRIRMRDLAEADVRFAAAEPDQPAGFAPQPGAKRVFWPPELMQLAKRNGIIGQEAFEKACFERRTKLIAAEDLIAAVRAWAPASSRIELVEQSKFPAPAGELVMPRPNLLRTAIDGSVVLHGFVRFGPDNKFPVWARVRLTVTQKIAVAAELIPAGKEISEDQITIEERAGGIEVTQLANELARVVGRTARKRIAPGEAIALAFLDEPTQVKRGAIVAVEVKDGATRLSLDARAETSGRTGQEITVRNPASGKSFQARVTGENTVSVFPRGVHFDGRNQN